MFCLFTSTSVCFAHKVSKKTAHYEIFASQKRAVRPVQPFFSAVSTRGGCLGHAGSGCVRLHRSATRKQKANAKFHYTEREGKRRSAMRATASAAAQRVATADATRCRGRRNALRRHRLHYEIRQVFCSFCRFYAHLCRFVSITRRQTVSQRAESHRKFARSAFLARRAPKCHGQRNKPAGAMHREIPLHPTRRHASAAHAAWMPEQKKTCLAGK